MLMEPKIEEFISNLVANLKSERVFDSIEKDIEFRKKDWDTVAKSKVGNVVKKVFQQTFPEEDVEKSAYVEGEHVPLELFLGRFEGKKSPYALFGGMGIFPDIAVTRPKLILIELDHSGTPTQGRSGSRLRTALAKASFGYMTGDWDYCFVFYHNRSGRRMEPYLKEQIEKSILDKYERDFHTALEVFE